MKQRRSEPCRRIRSVELTMLQGKGKGGITGPCDFPSGCDNPFMIDGKRAYSWPIG